MAIDDIIKDSDTAFEISTVSREITKTSSDKTIVQGDHNSERFSFVMPRYVEGHDMMHCDKVEIHFLNVDYQNKENQSKDIYRVKDVAIDEENEERIIFTWLLEGTATKYAGTLSFIIRFTCLDEDRIVYAWHTNISQEVTISKGMCFSEDIVAEHKDVIEQWKKEVLLEMEGLLISAFFRPIPDGVHIDDMTEENGYGGEYVVADYSNGIFVKERLYVNQSAFPAENGGDFIIVPCQIRMYFDEENPYLSYVIKSRYLVEGEWTEWGQVSSVEQGVESASIQNKSSQAGALVFKFDTNHVYSNDDITNQRYYIINPSEDIIGKPFSVVLGENYDFVGTITNVHWGVQPQFGDKDYITVDNYITPSTTDSRYRIDKDSYILIPYDEVQDGGSYAPLDYQLNERAHMLGYNPIGKGTTAFGYKCYAQSDGAFSAGWMNISSGKHSGTLGRFNTVGYCDFAFGQGLKFYGHWNGGFGRDNYIDRLADFCFTSGRLNVLNASYTAAFGLGHVVNTPYANARGLYSKDVEGIIDRVGYGTEKNPRNIYTLDTNGNAWFNGDVKIGSFGGRTSGAVKVSCPSELIALKGAKLGDVGIFENVVYSCKLGGNYSTNGLEIWTNSDNPAGDAYGENVVIGGKPCRKSGYFPNIVEDAKRWQKMIYLNLPAYNADDTYRQIDIKFSYYDLGDGGISIRHSAVGTSGVNIAAVSLKNTKEWKEAVVHIDAMKFNNGLNGQDLRFYCSDGKNMYISDVSVYIRKEDADSEIQYVEKNVYMLTSDEANAYANINNWVRINK